MEEICFPEKRDRSPPPLAAGASASSALMEGCGQGCYGGVDQTDVTNRLDPRWQRPKRVVLPFHVVKDMRPCVILSLCLLSLQPVIEDEDANCHDDGS